ncbi:Nn.00g113230.m01.CDS01 [Neocucurbitaria sp. VM-36]
MATDVAADIEGVVRELKVERDTWEAVASKYKAALETQTRRLQELQDICFATQAELENERAQQRRLHVNSDSSETKRPGIVDGSEDYPHVQSFGTAAILSPRQIDLDRQCRSLGDCTNPLFMQVQQSVAQRNYGTALGEVERLLCGPLSSKARAEGLLLKSNILRASGPDEMYDALAACSEALELCDRLSELETFLPRIQYQRGILYHELRLLHQAREAFSTVSNDESLHATASEYDEMEHLRVAKRRSGFDEKRTEELLAHLREQGLDVSSASVSSLGKCFDLEQASTYKRAAETICCCEGKTHVPTTPLEGFEERSGLRRVVVW